ncbi:MAG: hypothetical protein ACI3XQ_02255 [Eubacteriales bacterium]
MKGIGNKKITLIQGIISVIVIAIMLIMSFGNIFTFTLGSSETEMVEEVYKSFDMSVDVPESVDVNFMFGIRSVQGIATSTKTLVNAMKNAQETAKNISEDPTSVTEEPEILSESDRESLKGLVAPISFICALVDGFKTSVMTGILMFAMLILTMVTPIVCIFALLFALIALLKNLKDPDKSFPSISKHMTNVFFALSIYLLVMIAVPGISLSSNVTGMFILCGVAVLINAVAMRLKKMEPGQIKYLNVVEAVSAAGIVMFVVFALNLSKASALDKVIALLPAYFTSGAEGTLGKVFADFAILLVLVMISVILLVASFKYVFGCAYRFGCMGKKKPSCSMIVRPVFTLVATAIVYYCLYISPKYSKGVSDDGKGNLTVAFIGAILMLACEIVLSVLSKKMVAGISAAKRAEVLSNTPAEPEIAENVNSDAEASELTDNEPVADATESPVSEAATESADPDDAPIPEDEVVSEVSDAEEVPQEQGSEPDPAQETEEAVEGSEVSNEDEAAEQVADAEPEVESEESAAVAREDETEVPVAEEAVNDPEVSETETESGEPEKKKEETESLL